MSRKINHKISQRLAPIFGRRPGTRFVSQVNTVGTRDLLINKKPRVSCQIQLPERNKEKVLFDLQIVAFLDYL